MSNQLRIVMKIYKNNIDRKQEFKLRKHLNADALPSTMKTGFAKITDRRSGYGTFLHNSNIYVAVIVLPVSTLSC